MNPPGAQCRNRLFEWVMTVAMIGVAVIMIVSPRSIEVGAFRYTLVLLGSPLLMTVFFALVGGFRAFALWGNGKLKHGPRLRAAGAVLGALMWAQMALALVFLTGDTGTLSVGIPVYAALSGGEIISCYRAMRDVPIPR